MTSVSISRDEATAVQEEPQYDGSTTGRAILSDHDASLSNNDTCTDKGNTSASRPMQKVDASTPAAIIRPNRFSISFPIQPAPLSTSAKPQSPEQQDVSLSATDVKPPSVPTDTNFLTAIAAQERRVLELKEELARAEADLIKLKRQWAQHEVQKKRDDSRKATKLQDLHTASPVREKEDDTDGSSAWMQAEMERRKALMNQNRPAARTVFASSKHARTLSLLSSASTSDIGNSIPNPRPTRADSLSQPKPSSNSASSLQFKPLPMIRASTTPDLIAESANAVPTDKSIDGEILMKTGKKMATDFRDGLWTFWEDLRQATVGEEAATTPAKFPSIPRQNLFRRDGRNSPLRTSSKSPANSQVIGPHSHSKAASSGRVLVRTPRSAIKAAAGHSGSALADPSFWTEHGLALPSTPTTVKKLSGRHLVKPMTQDSFDSNNQDDSAWENWDDASTGTYSPRDSPSSNAASEAATVATTVSQSASPRCSTELSAKGLLEPPASEYALPWPSITAFGSDALRRTASHLVSEWEDSVDSPLRHEFTGGGDYLGEATETSTSILSTKKS